MAEGDDIAEIEVTPEMIAAGVRELSLFSTRDDPGGVIVESVYEAMERARISRLERP